MIESIPLILTGLGLIASILYYTTVLQNSNKTRRTQMLMELYQAYRNPEFARAWGEIMEQEYTDFDDYWQKYGSATNRTSWSNWQSVARVFHGVGVLVKRGMVDIDLVEELLATMVFVSWFKMGPILVEFREMRANSREEGKWWLDKYQSLTGFDYLYYELKKRSQTNR